MQIKWSFTKTCIASLYYIPVNLFSIQCQSYVPLTEICSSCCHKLFLQGKNTDENCWVGLELFSRVRSGFWHGGRQGDFFTMLIVQANQVWRLRTRMLFSYRLCRWDESYGSKASLPVRVESFPASFVCSIEPCDSNWSCGPDPFSEWCKNWICTLWSVTFDFWLRLAKFKVLFYLLDCFCRVEVVDGYANHPIWPNDTHLFSCHRLNRCSYVCWLWWVKKQTNKQTAFAFFLKTTLKSLHCAALKLYQHPHAHAAVYRFFHLLSASACFGVKVANCIYSTV